MRPMVPVFAVAMVLGLAVWAYQQNYATQDVLREIDDLNRDIAIQRERLAVLRAEWAYLNRPDRLRDLAEMNFDRLRLLPLSQTSFGTVQSLPYPEVIEAALPMRPGSGEAGQ